MTECSIIDKSELNIRNDCIIEISYFSILTFSHAKDDVTTCKVLEVYPFFEHNYLQSFVNKLAAILSFSVSHYVYIIDYAKI